jgi:hypothetical protein
MPGIPPAVKIGPHLYLVQELPQTDLSSDTLSARLDPGSQLISITGAATESLKCELLIHEAIHALLIGHSLSDEDEELVCTLLGPGLLAFIRDNWGFITYTKMTCLNEAFQEPAPPAPEPDLESAD